MHMILSKFFLSFVIARIPSLGFMPLTPFLYQVGVEGEEEEGEEEEEV